MRRSSDIEPGRRSGRGRRARDRLLSGEPPTGAAEPAQPTATDLEHILYFVGDDLREAALAVGGIERFLLAVEEAVRAGGDPEALEGLLGEADVDGRIADLDGALAALVGSLARLAAARERGDAAGYRAEISKPAARNA